MERQQIWPRSLSLDIGRVDTRKTRSYGFCDRLVSHRAAQAATGDQSAPETSLDLAVLFVANCSQEASLRSPGSAVIPRRNPCGGPEIDRFGGPEGHHMAIN
jgi:hypothetical protein